MTIKQQADAMLAKTGLLGILGDFGEVYLHGSYDMDLMVWHELDLGVQIEDLNRSTPFELLAALSRVVEPTVAMVVNQWQRESVFPARIEVEDNFLIDYRFFHSETEWKLDMMLVATEGDHTGPWYNRQIKQQFTPLQHEIIKSIKQQVVHFPQYRKSRWVFTHRAASFGAHEIYEAVFTYGATNVAEFFQYLKKIRGIDITDDLASSPKGEPKSS